MNIVLSCMSNIGRITKASVFTSCLQISLAAVFFIFQASTGLAAELNDIEAVPHLDSTGKDAYRKFLAADQHRAFVIAPGGAWSWKAEDSSAEAASAAAMQSCENDSGLPCVLYAVNNKVVFDAETWAKLWGPYQTRAEAPKSYIGKERGDRFYNLVFRDESGKLIKLSDLKGNVVLLHFWGSWCPPCLREMPELQQLHRALANSPDIKMILLQVREKFDTGRQWAQKQHLDLPLHDSRVKDIALDSLTMANGKIMHDREIAVAFPTTYVLDKHGIVVFSHVGPVSNWPQYLPLLRDVAARSGK